MTGFTSRLVGCAAQVCPRRLLLQLLLLSLTLDPLSHCNLAVATSVTAAVATSSGHAAVAAAPNERRRHGRGTPRPCDDVSGGGDDCDRGGDLLVLLDHSAITGHTVVEADVRSHMQVATRARRVQKARVAAQQVGQGLHGDNQSASEMYLLGLHGHNQNASELNPQLTKDPIGVSREFIVQITTKGCCGCGSIADIALKFEGVNASEQTTTSSWTTVHRFHQDGPMLENSTVEWVVNTMESIYPMVVCLRTSNGDDFCVEEEEGIVVLDGGRPQRKYAYGAASQFPILEQGEEHCVGLRQLKSLEESTATLNPSS